MSDELNYEIEFIAFENGATSSFQFHGDNLALARDHANQLLKDLNFVKRSLEWPIRPVGRINARFRKIGTDTWRKVQ